MSKTEKLNDLLREELAAAVNREAPLPEALITITYVKCSPDLEQAQIGFSILPDRLAGTALRHLTASTGRLAATVGKRLKLRKMPHFSWEFDATEKDADFIGRLVDEANSL